MSFHPVEKSVKFHLMTWAVYFKRRKNQNWKTPIATMLRKYVHRVIDVTLQRLQNISLQCSTYTYMCVHVCVCFVCWLELDSSIALCNLSSLYATSSLKYSGLFSTIIALNQTQLSNHRTDQFWILANQITKFVVSINPRNVYLYVFQNNLPFLKCSIII